MPKRTCDELTESDDSSEEQQQQISENKKPKLAEAAHQPPSDLPEALVGAVPADLLALLATLPRRFLAPAEFNEKLKALPHVLSLEILDGIAAGQLFEKSSDSCLLRDFVGRFTNSSDRKFVVIRRNFVICDSELSWEVKDMCSNRANPQVRNKPARALGLMLRQARRICWKVHDGYITDFVVLFDALFKKASLLGFLGNLRNVDLTFTHKPFVTSAWDGVPQSLFPFVSHFSILCDAVKNESASYIQKMTKLRSLCAPQGVDWSLVPLSQLRRISFDESSLFALEKFADQATSLQSFDISVTYHPSVHTTQDLLRWSTKLRRVDMDIRRYVLGIDQMTSLTCLRIDFTEIARFLSPGSDQPQQMQVAIRKLNERGQLTSLEMWLKGNYDVRSIRNELEGYGIGHPNCALRNLHIRGYEPLALEAFVPILQCSTLETLNVNVGYGQSMQKALIQYCRDKGLILEHGEYGGASSVPSR